LQRRNLAVTRRRGRRRPDDRRVPRPVRGWSDRPGGHLPAAVERGPGGHPRDRHPGQAPGDHAVTAATLSPTLVAGDGALAVFRQGLTGVHALHLLQQAQGRLLVQLPVGVGKTAWLVAIIAHALATALHDLVITLVPLRDVLNELLQRLPASLSPAVL